VAYPGAAEFHPATVPLGEKVGTTASLTTDRKRLAARDLRRPAERASLCSAQIACAGTQQLLNPPYAALQQNPAALGTRSRIA
jgi:hypothetical protein